MKTEHEEQRELVMWMRQTYPGVRIFAITNGRLLYTSDPADEPPL